MSVKKEELFSNEQQCSDGGLNTAIRRTPKPLRHTMIPVTFVRCLSATVDGYEGEGLRRRNKHLLSPAGKNTIILISAEPKCI
jgi:hypothetical protein